ncbi:MAG: glycosyltransferase [Anaerolineae bacterium]|nr:glycosyltransferase [Anaerolineae bacterium]
MCLLSGEFPPMQGGVGDFTREIGLALNGLGATVSAVSSVRASQSSTAPRSSHDGVTIRRNGLHLTLFPVVERWDFSSWSQVSGVLRHTSSEILNVQYQTAAYQMHPAVNFLPWRLRVRRERPGIVTTFHDLKLPYLFPKAGPVRRWVTSALMRGSDATIVTNVEDRSGAEAYAPRSLHLFPIGSNIDPQAPPGYDREKWRERWGVRPEETLLCYFGFLNESKGGETLFRALGRLVASGERVKLLMIGGRVGSSDPTNVAYVQKMEVLIDELDIADHVSWTDYVDAPEVTAGFWSSDICVLPYRDGASFRRGTLMAALAHGVPIVSTYPRVEVAEIVENENMGLVPPDDDEALAHKISQVAASPQLRERLAKGAAGLSTLFSWEGIAQNTMEVYEEVLASRA